LTPNIPNDIHLIPYYFTKIFLVKHLKEECIIWRKEKIGCKKTFFFPEPHHNSKRNKPKYFIFNFRFSQPNPTNPIHETHNKTPIANQTREPEPTSK